MNLKVSLQCEIEGKKKFSLFEIFCELRTDSILEIKEKKIINAGNELIYLMAEKKFCDKFGFRAYGSFESFTARWRK